ncbi:cupin domain-containing protein [Actinopolyspora xinjiangensis]|uniref:cupin domain-containing protein n=1 Tax=Actinopolyspora xinjiangensis TaxID=405564 RepID=UPI00147D5253|nr:cupin domain-containing protein [Actinopolyspora xinjiangensis]
MGVLHRIPHNSERGHAIGDPKLPREFLERFEKRALPLLRGEIKIDNDPKRDTTSQEKIVVSSPAKPAILRHSDFDYRAIPEGSIAEPVGTHTGAEKIALNVVRMSPEEKWKLDRSASEENIVVVFDGSGEAETINGHHVLDRGAALYSPTGQPLELLSGKTGLHVYVWRSTLRGDEQRSENPRTFNRLDNDETQLKNFYGTEGMDPSEETAVMNFVFWPGTGSSRLCLHCGHMEPGQTFNVHVHPESEEAFMAFSGSGQFYLADGWYPAEAGDVLFAPPGVPHGTRLPRSDEMPDEFVTCGGPTPFDKVLYERASVPTEVK